MGHAVQFLPENSYLHSMGRIVICVYRPHAGKEEALLELVSEHIPLLKSQRLVTDRKPVIMRAADNCIVEVFEWQDADAISKAHENPVVKDLWKRFGEVCSFEIPAGVAEFHAPFPEFEAMN